MHVELYEVTQRYKDILTLIDGDLIKEEDVKAALDELRDEVEEKADSLACIVKSLLADIEAFKTEKARLNERQKKAEQYVDLLKMYLHDSMLDAGLKKIETSRNRIAFTSSKRVIVSDEESFKERYPDLCRQTVKIDLDKKAIKEAIESGEKVAGAEIVGFKNISIK